MAALNPITVLAYVGGVASTVAGSWVSSKIHVYHENRRVHLEEIKQRVLLPLSAVLSDYYAALVTHDSPAVVEQWGTRRRRENIRVTEDVIDDGPLLLRVAPDMKAGVDSALHTDAMKNHFSKLLSGADRFSEAWNRYTNECHAWIVRLADEILAKSQMEQFPVKQYGTPNVDHFKLALFVYQRLFGLFERPVVKNARNPPHWELVGFEGTPAVGSEQQLDGLISVLDDLMVREKNFAERLQAEARLLEKSLSSLSAELAYAIASRRLRKRCDLVPFV